MVTVFHYTPVNAKQFDGLNIDGLAAWKASKTSEFPPVKILRYTVCDQFRGGTHYNSAVIIL